MADMTTLEAKYFAAGGDLAPGEALTPYQTAGNTVTTLVDGNAYFGALRAEVAALKAPGGSSKFFYFSNWLLTLIDIPGGHTTAGSGVTAWDNAPVLPATAFKLDDGSGAAIPNFIDELAEMAANGTDVRALAWVSPLVLSYEAAAAQAGYIYSNNAQSALSINALRQKPNMGNKACLNTLAHPLGAMHVKMVVCGDSTGGRGYVSGLDFDNSRVDGNGHPNAATGGWHDVGVRVEGPGAQGVYGAFRRMWNELINEQAERFRIGDTKIDNYVDGTPAVPESPPFDAGGGGTAGVQVLRTVPQMHFSIFSTDRAPIGCFKRLISGFGRDPWQSEPNGLFAFQASLQKAISNAEKYIYVEDQGFWGHPIMEWLRDRLATRPDLKLIMTYRSDPQDGANAIRNMAVSVNAHLGSAGVNMNSQVAFYTRTDNVVMHSKIWIFDDEFLIAGSANAFRRSLYTDGEISVGVIDDNDTDTNAAINFRRQLWGEHCGLLTDPDRAVLTDLDDAFKIWDPSWGAGAGAAPASLLPTFVRKRVPFEVGTDSDQWPALNLDMSDIVYDQLDGDSRLEY
jgi:phosphatidylserine/phosphatidylglycerophosphate/cardiolipin synthase-like enzyme